MPGISENKVSQAKANVCGLEVPYEITWTNWKVGKEYQKTLSIKNPSYEPRKVKVRMPPSNIFKMIYDKKIFIAPGNVFKVPVLFIPKDEVEYSESLEIRNKLGCFCIVLHAIVPQRARVELKMPSNIDMGMCAVGHKTNATFQICNVGSVDTEISIESLHPLCIQPQRFQSRAGDFVSLVAVFTPHLAKSFSMNVVVRYGNDLETSSCILFTGRGKYALLQAFICPKKCCHQKIKCSSPITNCNCNNVDVNNNNNNNNNNSGNTDFEGPDDDDDVAARNQSQPQSSTFQPATIAAVYKERSKFKNKMWGNKKVAPKAGNRDGNNGTEDNTGHEMVALHQSSFSNNASGEFDFSEEAAFNSNNNNNDSCNVDHRVNREAKVLLNFGEVTPGGKSKKHVIVKNMSMVDSYYTIVVPRHKGGCRCCGDDDECSAQKIFHLENGEGFLKAGCCQEVTISFRPKETGLSYKVELLLQSSSGLKSVHDSVTTDQVFPRTAITCIGRCSAPKVFLCQELLCFPVVELPSSFTKNLEIINRSQFSAYFQFQVDNENSTFQIEPQNGEVPAMGRTIIRVTFAPKVPMNYYRKVACLVHHKGVMYLQLLGTCRSGDIIPVALNQCHLTRYDCFCREGLSFLPPRHITGMIEKGYQGKDETSNDMEQKRMLSNNEDFLDDGCTSSVAKCMPHVSTDVNLVDFGNLEFGCPPMKKVLCLTNHTRGPIIVQWIYCHEFKHFSVVPNRKLVCGEQSAMFTFTFEPTKQNQFYSSEFECYATPEMFSNYKTTDERILFPPWCITITVSGNSFGYGCERFHPNLELDRPLLTLRSVKRHAPSFETIRIFNAGKDPAVFQLERDGAEMFLHKPSSGLVSPGANRIVLFMFNPQMLGCSSTKIERCFKMTINDQPPNDRPIKIRASIAVPSIAFGSGGKLTLRPTCTGLQSSAKETVSSSCCTPLHFKWIVPVAHKGMLDVEPSEGFLGPFEAQAHTWHFRSCHYEDKLVKVRLQVRLVSPKDDGEGGGASGCHGDGDGTCPCQGEAEETSFGLEILTRGTRATLASKEDRVRVGPLLVGSRCSRRLTEISNDFDCDVIYKLHVVEEVAMPTALSCPQSSDEDEEEEEEEDEDGGCYDDDNGSSGNDGSRAQYKFSRSPPLMRIFPQWGVLPSRTKQTIRAIIDTVDRRHYRWNVSFTLHDSQGNVLSQQPEQRLFQVTACGIIPELSLADICTGGSAKCISRSYMWRMFSVDRLNTKIKCDVGNNMKRFSQSQTGSVDFHFPAGPTGIKPCVIVLVVKNPGFVPCEWKIFLPSELKIKVNKWAESGEMTAEECREMEIVDNKLFTISPGRGFLDVGQSCCVTLTYDHLIEGQHVLPIILKIKHGNEVKINLCGLTVPREVPHLHLPLREFRLEPVFLGTCQGPLQSFEVLNSGSTEVNFTVDTSSLEQLAKANYDYRVMECPSTSGCIRAGEMGVITVRLNPIEAKIYSVDLTIQVEGGDCYLITFTGEGKDFRCRISKSDQTCSSVSNSSIPDQQLCVGPEQICRLSVNQLDFGDLPTLCTSKRLVTLRNCSQQHSACYKWNVKNPCHAQVVKIEPPCGCLNPGDSVMSKVILRSGEQPSILEVDLICEISNLTELTKHREDMQCYLKARHKVMTEVDFSEVDHNQDINCIRNVEFEGHLYADELEGDIKYPKYKTLPPIVRVEPQKFNRRVAKKIRKNFVERPRTPTSEILFLSVRGKTYDLNEHKILFPDNHHTFFFDRCIGSHEDAKPGGGCSDEDVNLRLTLRQYEVMSGIFSSLLRDLLDDESFISACVEVAGEPTPYFQQFVGDDEKKERDPCKPITNIRDSDEDDEKVDKQPPQENFGNQDEASLMKRETMKKSPGFGILSEGMLEDTLFNIIQEAYHGEFSITARPRLLALATAKDRQPVAGCEQSDD